MYQFLLCVADGLMEGVTHGGHLLAALLHRVSDALLLSHGLPHSPALLLLQHTALPGRHLPALLLLDILTLLNKTKVEIIESKP